MKTAFAIVGSVALAALLALSLLRDRLPGLAEGGALYSWVTGAALLALALIGGALWLNERRRRDG